MAAELLVLRLIHILGGIFWVGSALFTTFFLIPALTKAGLGTVGPVMFQLQQRKLYTALPLAAVLTILSGIRLMWIVSAGDTHWFVHRVGHTYAVSGALAIVAFVLSLVVARPAAMRVGKLSQSTASDGASRELLAAEIAALQRRVTLSTMVVVVMLVLAAAGMAIARYV